MFRLNRRALLLLALVLVCFLTANFALRGLRQARRLRAGSEEPVQAWMNVPFIAHAYRVPPEVIAQAIGLPPGERDRRPLREIAQSQGRPADELVAAVTAAIDGLRPPPPPEVPTAPGPPERAP